MLKKHHFLNKTVRNGLKVVKLCPLLVTFGQKELKSGTLLLKLLQKWYTFISYCTSSCTDAGIIPEALLRRALSQKCNKSALLSLDPCFTVVKTTFVVK